MTNQQDKMIIAPNFKIENMISMGNIELIFIFIENNAKQNMVSSGGSVWRVGVIFWSRIQPEIISIRKIICRTLFQQVRVQ